MFEAAEWDEGLERGLQGQVPALREELLDAQRGCATPADRPVIVLFGGVDGAGKSESVNLLNEWMDPRWLLTRAYGPPSDEERERPEYWRFWRDLPPKGRIGFFLSAWYSRPLVDRVHRRIEPRRVRRAARRDRRLRAGADRRRRADPEVLDAPRQAVAEGAAEEAREGSADTLARHQGAVGQLEAVRPVHRRRRRDHHADEPGERAVDDRRGRRRAVSKPDGRHGRPRRDPQAAGRFARRTGGAGAHRAARNPRVRRAAKPRRRRATQPTILSAST